MMKKTFVLMSCGVLTALSAGCATTNMKPATATAQATAQNNSSVASNNNVTNDSSAPEKVGYSFGYLMGKSNADAVKDLDVNTFLAGFKDGYGGKAAALTEDQMKTTLLQYKQNQDAVEMKAFEQKAKANTEAATKFLADNAKKEGVKTTASGLQYQVLKQGTGKRPTATSKVTVHYEGRLMDGTVFDSSIDRGEPLSFALNQVIAGWTEGLQLMQEGSKYRFVIPSNLAYGETGAGESIGPNSTLIFDVELLKVEK